MLFNSLHFLLFFPLVVGFYFCLPYRHRWVLLLAASYYFYMCWKAEYLLLIVVSTLIDYGAAIGMESRESRAGKRLFLLLSLLSNLGILFAFKYFNFVNSSLRLVLTRFDIFYDVPAFKALLPVGISFYTFQTLSYSIDVYRGQRSAERNLGMFALYVAFFPQLVAGPIERSTRLLPQFYRRCDFDVERVGDGLKQMGWGFFKKVVIADRLAAYVNQVYNHPTDYAGLPLILATYFFAFQIYCDFSGYSDIAIGASRVMGFELMENFRRPYFAKSIAEFWQRWHISLSTWFRDYLYIPLGGNRVAKWRWYANLAAVFLISGLWHGANWTFVVWGGLHGFYLVVSLWTASLRQRVSDRLALDRIPGLLAGFRVLVTFHLVLFSWIFFRANSLGEAFYIVRTALTGFNLQQPLGLGRDQLALSVLSIGCLLAVNLLQRDRVMRSWLSARPIWIRWPAYQLVLVGILLLGVFADVDFIYFQF